MGTTIEGMGKELNTLRGDYRKIEADYQRACEAVAQVKAKCAAEATSREAVERELSELDLRLQALQVERDALIGERDLLVVSVAALAARQEDLAQKKGLLSLAVDSIRAERDALVLERDALVAELTTEQPASINEPSASAKQLMVLKSDRPPIAYYRKLLSSFRGFLQPSKKIVE